MLHGGDRGGASPRGMSVTADTMPMPAAAARAPITDSPAPLVERRGAATHSKGATSPGGTGAAQPAQQRATARV